MWPTLSVAPTTGANPSAEVRRYLCPIAMATSLGRHICWDEFRRSDIYCASIIARERGPCSKEAFENFLFLNKIYFIANIWQQLFYQLQMELEKKQKT